MSRWNTWPKNVIIYKSDRDLHDHSAHIQNLSKCIYLLCTTAQNQHVFCPCPPWSSAMSFNSLKVSLFVLNDRQELYHGKPQWHSKASIFTTCKHQWPNLKDWLIPLLTWLGAGGCVYERQQSLFNSARCRRERVMSFKLHCYASACLCCTTFQVQAYFEEEAQSCTASW